MLIFYFPLFALVCLAAVLARSRPALARTLYGLALLPIFTRDSSGMLASRVLGTLPQLDLNSLSDEAFVTKL